MSLWSFEGRGWFPRFTTSGGHSGGGTPLPIPNRAVKPASADGTRRATSRESRSPPDFFRKAAASGLSSFYDPLVELRAHGILLRPPTPDDAGAIVAEIADAEILRFVPLIPDPYERADAESWIERSERAW